MTGRRSETTEIATRHRGGKSIPCWKVFSDIEESTFWCWTKYFLILKKVFSDIEERIFWYWTKHILILNKVFFFSMRYVTTQNRGVSKAVWNFYQNPSVLVGDVFPIGPNTFRNDINKRQSEVIWAITQLFQTLELPNSPKPDLNFTYPDPAF